MPFIKPPESDYPASCNREKMPRKFKEIHVVSNTHWDREFRFPFQRTRMFLVQMIDYLLYLLEDKPEYASYTMDAHTILVEDYLEIRPENRGRIEKLVKDRRLFLGPWYTLPDIPNIGQESVIRNLIYGHKVSKEFGHTMKIGYTPCSWGQTGQLPQIYAGFDIDTILFYRGISPHECTSEFIWEGVDGTRALAHRFALFARYNYYYLVFRKITYGLDINDRRWWWGQCGETPFKSADAEARYATVELLQPDILYQKDRLNPALEEMLNIEGGQYFGPFFLAMHGHDISWPHPLEPAVIRDADNALDETTVIHSDLERYFATLKENLDLSKLPLLKGERRTNLKEGYWTYLLPGTISARTRLKKENFQAEMLLVHQAEPAATLAWLLGAEYPTPYLDLAWRHLLCTHTHDANAGCAPDDVTEDVQYHLRQSRQLSEAIVQEALKFLVTRIHTSVSSPTDQFLVIFNSLPFERSELLELLIDVPEEAAAQSLAIYDAKGASCPFQTVSLRETGLFVDNRWNVPQAYLTTRFCIKMLAEKIPPFGYKVYKIVSFKKPDRKAGTRFTSQRVMENEFMKVEACPDGTISLTDNQTGAVYHGLLGLEDEGEVGNAWRHVKPAQDTVVTTAEKVTIKKVEDGPLSATIKIDLTLSVPRQCPDEQSRSQELVSLPVTHFVTLTQFSRNVEIRTRFCNMAEDHRLRLLFPTGLDVDKSFADSHFDVVGRDISLPDCTHWKEPVVGTYPYRTFVDLSDGEKGLALLSEGLQEYEISRDERKAIALTLVRAVRIKLEVSEQRKQELPDKGPQCPGWHEFRMAVFPHKGNWEDACCPRESLCLSVPLRSAQFGKNKQGDLPPECTSFSCNNHFVQVSASKKGERGDNIILRLYNPTTSNQEVEIVMYREIKSVKEVNLNEEIRDKIPHSGNGFKMSFLPKKIRTVQVEINKIPLSPGLRGV